MGDIKRARGAERAGVPPEVFGAVLNRLADPICLITAQSKLLFANRAAKDLLVSGHLVLDASGVISPSRKSDSVRWRDAVASLLGSPTSMDLVFTRPAGHPLIVSLAAVGAKNDAPGDDATVLVVFSDTKPSADAAHILEHGFRVSPAEAQIAAALAADQSVARIAKERDVAETTIRSQLRSVIGKLGVRRQTGLARLVGAIRPKLYAHKK
jgi:DNA-binding CsgD family transcriptional regulator